MLEAEILLWVAVLGRGGVQLFKASVPDALSSKPAVASDHDFSKSLALVCTLLSTSRAASSNCVFIFFSSSSSIERLTSALTSAT